MLMRLVRVEDSLWVKAHRVACQLGYPSVDRYIEDCLRHIVAGGDSLRADREEARSTGTESLVRHGPPVNLPGVNLFRGVGCRISNDQADAMPEVPALLGPNDLLLGAGCAESVRNRQDVIREELSPS